MFYSSRKPLSKSLPKVPPSNNVEDKTRDDILGLQRFINVNNTPNNDNKRISIIMNEDDEEVKDHDIEYVNLKQSSAIGEMNAIGMLMDRDIKKALWVNDPLRLNLDQEEKEENEDQPEEEDSSFPLFPFDDVHELPYRYKLKSKEFEANLLNSLYIVMNYPVATPKSTFSSMTETTTDYLELALQLPFATAALFPPTPPPKQLSTTPAMPPPIILPPEMYEIYYESRSSFDHNTNAWLYHRDEDQSTFMTTSPRMSTTANSVLYFDCEEEDNKDFTEETWEAIFHPLSTFKHKKGELEYYAWNPTNLPVAAARVAQRVIHARAFGPDTDDDVLPSPEDDGDSAPQGEATLPQLAPTPPLKPSPVLTIVSDELENSDSQLTLVAVDGENKKQEDGYYYDMLKKIRGNQRYSNASSLASSLVSDSQITIHEEDAQDKTVTQLPKPKRAHLLSHILIAKHTNKHKAYNDEETPRTNAMMMDPENLLKQQDNDRYWTGQKLFWTGFLCPLLWFYGSFFVATKKKSHDPNDIRWQKRCRLASVYFSIIMSVVVMVAVVKSAGAAGVRQTQSDTIRAVIAN